MLVYISFLLFFASLAIPLILSRKNKTLFAFEKCECVNPQASAVCKTCEAATVNIINSVGIVHHLIETGQTDCWPVESFSPAFCSVLDLTTDRVRAKRRAIIDEVDMKHG